jgi:hypothetical protein
MSDVTSQPSTGILRKIVRWVRMAVRGLSALLGRGLRWLLRLVWPSYTTSLSLREKVNAALVVALFVVVSWAGLWLSFTAGRVFAEHGNKLFGAGPSINDLQARQAELETALATEQAQRQIERATYAKVAHDLAELQAQISEQNEELGFYRSVMTPRNLPYGIKVQQIKIIPADALRRFKLQIVMIGDNRSAAVEQVSAEVMIEGVRNNLAVTVPMERLNPSSPRLNFSFRYFDEQQLTIDVPADVFPKRLVLEIRSPHINQVLRQAVPWRVQPL